MIGFNAGESVGLAALSQCHSDLDTLLLLGEEGGLADVRSLEDGVHRAGEVQWLAARGVGTDDKPSSPRSCCLA